MRFLSLPPLRPGQALSLSLLFLFALLLAVPARAQRVSIYTDADTVTVGERFHVAITAEHNGVAELVFPDPAQGDSTFGDLLILGRQDFESRFVGGADPGARVDSVVYEVATFALDSALVPPIPVRFVVAEQTYTVGTEPLVVRVRSLVPPEAQDIQDLAPLVEFPRPWWHWLLFGLGILLLAALVWYFVHRLRKRAPIEAPPPPVRIVSPYEEAEERLRRLEETDLHHAEQVKPFYVELSDLLRTYLARRLDVPAMERTTREVIRDLDRAAPRKRLPSDVPARTRELLEFADLVKFADLHPEPAQGRRSVEKARALLQQVEQSQRSPESSTEREKEGMSERVLK